jgi:hypothetical protein
VKDLLGFSDDSRVWIYQADRPFDEHDLDRVNADIEAFCTQWTSHNRELRATGGVMHDRFVVLVVDESQTSASGCSIDKSVAFVKYLEQEYGRQLLLRHQVAWINPAGDIETVALDQLSEAVRAGRIGPETRVFDNLVANRRDYLQRWVVPLRESWMKRFA